MKLKVTLLLGTLLVAGCDENKKAEDSSATATDEDSTDQKSKDLDTSAKSQIPDVPSVHFFSVPWGCVNVEKSKMEQSDYEIVDYEVKEGSCPASIDVVDLTSVPFITCEIKIANKIDGLYILYDKRSFDGETVSDLTIEGFTEDNFCPVLASKEFK